MCNKMYKMFAWLKQKKQTVSQNNPAGPYPTAFIPSSFLLGMRNVRADSALVNSWVAAERHHLPLE